MPLFTSYYAVGSKHRISLEYNPVPLLTLLILLRDYSFARRSNDCFDAKCFIRGHAARSAFVSLLPH